MIERVFATPISLLGKYLQFYSYISKPMLILAIISILDLFFNFIPFFVKKELIEIIIVVSYGVYLLGANL